MLKESKNPLTGIFRLFDVIIIIISYFLAYLIRFGIQGIDILHTTLEFISFFVAYLIFWVILSNKFNLYQSKRRGKIGDETIDVIKTTGLSLLFASIPAFYFRDHPLSRLFLVYFWPIHTILLIFFRIVIRSTLKYLRRHGYNYRQVLIVGRNSRTEKIVQKIDHTPEYGLKILGFIDDEKNNCHYPNKNKFNLMGNLNDFERIMRKEVVDEVFITLPMKSYYAQIEQIVNICEKSGIEVEIPADIFDIKFAKTAIQKYDELKVIDYYTSPEMDWKLVVKRLIDITISLLILAFSLPTLLVIGLIIKIISKGPVFFMQKRIGYNGRYFTLLKFRTMVQNAEDLKHLLLDKNEMDGPVFKMKNDPRITRIGHFLRRSSIDELPQLINVLKGEMSLVGPRPPTPEEVIRYQLIDRRRLSMRPGITCLWQVKGRNRLTFRKWMELDRQYIDNWSLWLDLKILLQTIPAVLKGSGAE
jgi:exopolysaccharide biosynthesis polyprenyl glycosylphosphotransferase